MAGYKFDYEQKVWGGEKIRLSPIYFRASRLYWALKGIPDKKGRLLDVGCGAGDFLEAFSFYRPGYKLDGIDISEKAISQAKKRGLKVNFKAADAQKLPYKNNSFDVVTCFDLIEHVEVPQKVLDEIYRVLKPKGVFHTFIPTEAELLSLEGPLIKFGWKGKEIYGGHPHHFSKNQVISWLKKAGFEVKEVHWGEHFVNQIIEIVYFTVLSMRGKNSEGSVEGMLAKASPSPFIYFLKIAKSAIATASFIETMTLNRFPGLGVHVTCQKK